MRISIVTGFFLPVPPLKGGATERSWHGLANVFAAQGHAVTLVSRSWPGLAQSETADGVRYIRLEGFNHRRRLSLNVLMDFIWGVRVAQVLPAADVVICNTLTLPAWLRWVYPKAGRLIVMIGRTPKGQVSFYRSVARIYAPSTFLASQISQPWASRRTKVIGYPIEWSLHAAASAQKAAPVTIGYAGRLHPEKGIDLLVRAACLLAARTDLPEWRLQLVGPSSVQEGGGGEEWVAALKRESAAILGDRIEWLGPEYNAGRLALLYGGMDVFCYPSLAEKGETFGVSVAEAMAAGCAVVVSSLGCFSDLVQDNQTGLVFDHRSPNPESLLSERIVQLITDPVLRAKLASSGRQRARHYSYPEVSQLILNDLALLTGTEAKN